MASAVAADISSSIPRHSPLRHSLLGHSLGALAHFGHSLVTLVTFGHYLVILTLLWSFWTLFGHFGRSRLSFWLTILDRGFLAWYTQTISAWRQNGN
jgi:hypothetical protein